MFLTGPCMYTKKRYRQRDPNRPHPGFVKDPSYQYQKELRAVWVPRSLPIQPTFVRIPALRAACSLYITSHLSTRPWASQV